MYRTLVAGGTLAIFVLALLVVACGSDPSTTSVPATTSTADANYARCGGHQGAVPRPNCRANSAADAEAEADNIGAHSSANASACRGANARTGSASYGGSSDTGANYRGAGGSWSQRRVFRHGQGAGDQHRNR